MNDEGYIKFNPTWKKQAIDIDSALVDKINEIRAKLIEKNWIGLTKEGIGFGNISVRIENTSEFLITGSATGGTEKLLKSDFAIVKSTNIQKNSLQCKGETIASSESMSHAIFYQQIPAINAVIHIHDSKIWSQFENKLPTSDLNASYGTQEMALSIQNTISKDTSGIIIMGGHRDGIIAYGQNLNQALVKLNTISSLI